MSERKLVPIIFAAAIGAMAAFTGAASADALWPVRPDASPYEALRAQYRTQYRQQSPGAPAYLNGHRGYRNYHPGYRRHGDFWFPPAAFALGAIIGGAIATAPGPRYDDGYYGPRYYERRVEPAPTRRYSSDSAHVRWCYNRYRSYRAWDNSFQPYRGPRQQCWSPYS